MKNNDYDVSITVRGRRLTVLEVLLEVLAVTAILSLFAWGAP